MADEIEHVPGCDERHTGRQRCSTWVPAPPPTPPLPAEPMESGQQRASVASTLYAVARSSAIMKAGGVLMMLLSLPLAVYGWFMFSLGTSSNEAPDEWGPIGIAMMVASIALFVFGCRVFRGQTESELTDEFLMQGITKPRLQRDKLRPITRP